MRSVSLALLFACTPADTKPHSSDTDADADTDTDTDTDTDADTDADADTDTDTDTAPRTLSSGEHTLEHGGLSRSFWLYLPDTLEAGAPLVVVLHGYGGSASGIQGYAGLDTLAAEQGFAVVYPQSTADAWGWSCWNVGYCGNDEVDDVGFVREVVSLVRADQGLGAVLTTGMSNGGDMTYRMACEASDIVDVAAPVAGCLMRWLAESCAPARPPPLLHIHGRADNITLWDGDPSYTGGGYYGTLESVGTIAALHAADSYTTETNTDDGAYTVHSWARADATVPVQLVELHRGGHDWPVTPRHDIDAAEQMMSFFEEQLRGR